MAIFSITAARNYRAVAGVELERGSQSKIWYKSEELIVQGSAALSFLRLSLGLGLNLEKISELHLERGWKEAATGEIV